MMDFIKSLKVRWHVLAVALVAALPEILNYLGVIDLKPILLHFVGENTASLIVGILPFVLLFLRSAIHVDESKEGE